MKSENEVTFKSLFLPLTTKKAIIFIFIIGFAVFFNSLFNPFQADDAAQIVKNPFIKDIKSILVYFSRGMAYSGDYSFKMFHMQYRPIYYSVYTVLYQLVGPTPFYYHFIQLILHCVVTSLLFFVFSKFLKKEFAFILSSIYLIHTANTESVISIGSYQDVLFVLFGLIAFALLLIKSEKLISFKDLIIMLMLILLSVLSKETGMAYLGVLLVYIYLFNKENLRRFMSSIIIFILTYFCVRYLVSFATTVDINLSLVQKASTYERLLTLPKIIYYYISTFFYPAKLAIAQSWMVTNISFSDFYFPLVIDILFLALVIAGGIITYKKDKFKFKLYLFFISWFIFGLGLHIQLIPLDATVADRYFYFPMIGLLGGIGVLISCFKKELLSNTSLKYTGILIFCLIYIALIAMTLTRNYQWKSEYALLENDTKYAQSPLLDSYFGGLLISYGKLDQAKYYLDRSISEDPKIGHNFNNLAVYYEQKKDYETAKKYYFKALKYDDKFPDLAYASYNGLSHISMLSSNFPEAIKYAKQSIKIWPNNIHAIEYLTISEYMSGQKDLAVKTLKDYYDISQDSQLFGILDLMKNDKLIFPLLQGNGDVVF
jgi:protein O-mannosyl-transferase